MTEDVSLVQEAPDEEEKSSEMDGASGEGKFVTSQAAFNDQVTRKPRTIRSNNEAISRARQRLEILKKHADELPSETDYLAAVAELQQKIKGLEEENVKLGRLQELEIQNRKRQSLSKRRGQESSRGILALLANLWFLRSLALVTGGIISSLLLAYSFIFLNTFVTFGDSTSYFPWSWAVRYASLPPVLAEYYGGLGVSLVGIAFCVAGLWYCVPRLLKSL